MLEGWRWYGPQDPVTLRHVRQAGARHVVTALHHLYDGRAWSFDDVMAHKHAVHAEGLVWSVCESIPVPTSIKVRDRNARRDIGAWKQSLASLGRAGVPVVCFNFMPVLDWTRTDLAYQMPSTGLALRFDIVDFILYDVFVLKRCGAEEDYDPRLLREAEKRLAGYDDARLSALEHNLIAGLPGGEGRHDRNGLLAEISRFADMGADDLRANLLEFVREVSDVAMEENVLLSIHPDDPPLSLLGLPRVVSTADDLRYLFAAVPSPANGMVLCTGSYGVREDNDVVAMAREFGPRIHFAHLRNVQREGDGSFHESGHLAGSVDMIEIVRVLLAEESRRASEGHPQLEITMRSDHGHVLVDDLDKQRINPGYSCIGRLKGLAELRGVMQTIERFAVTVEKRELLARENGEAV